jgi:hypothetical protein
MGELPMVHGRIARPSIVDPICGKKLKMSYSLPIAVERRQLNRRFIKRIKGNKHPFSRDNVNPHNVISLHAPIISLAGRVVDTPRVSRLVSVQLILRVVGLRCIREIGDGRIGVLARFLRSILEGNVRLAAHTLEVKGGTPRISDQFPAFDRKRGNA